MKSFTVKSFTSPIVFIGGLYYIGVYWDMASEKFHKRYYIPWGCYNLLLIKEVIRYG